MLYFMIQPLLDLPQILGHRKPFKLGKLPEGQLENSADPDQICRTLLLDIESCGKKVHSTILLTDKAPITTAADGILNFFFKENKLKFHVICLQSKQFT